MPLPLHGGEGFWLWRWDLRPDVPLVLLAFGLLSTRGWLALRRRLAGRSLSLWRLASYWGGLLALALALLSPLDAYSEESFAVHMAAHMLLLGLGPVLLLLADPLPVALWGLPARLRDRVLALLKPQGLGFRLLQALTSIWVSWPLFVLTLWLWHYPPLFRAALAHDRLHDLEHLSFFLTALLFWWPVVGAAPRPATPYGLRLAHLALGLVQNTLLGSLIALANRAYYALGPSASLWDQRLGGLFMWLGMGMGLMTAIVLLFYRLLLREEQRASLHQSIRRGPLELEGLLYRGDHR